MLCHVLSAIAAAGLIACAPAEDALDPVLLPDARVDSRPPDGEADGPAPADASHSDARSDAAPLDAAVDALPVDALPVDALPPDATPDASADAMPHAEPRRVIHLAPGAAIAGEPVIFDLPAGFEAILIQARGPADGVYGVQSVDGPDGPLIGPMASRTTLNPEVAVALLPDTGRIERLAAGAYTVVFAAAGADARPLEVEVYAVDGPGAVLPVTLHIPPSVRPADDAAVLLMAAALEEQLARAFAVQATVTAQALADDSPDTLALDGARLDFAALVALGRASASDGVGLDLYLVDRITDGGDGLTGFSGGLPAPVGLPGSAARVTAVPVALLDDFPDAVADRAVHELGHALGLFHTTGAFGRVDPIADTPACPAECDADRDGVFFAGECGARGRGAPPCQGAADNLMFWTLGGDRTVTEGQRAVVLRHPAVESAAAD